MLIIPVGTVNINTIVVRRCISSLYRRTDVGYQHISAQGYTANRCISGCLFNISGFVCGNSNIIGIQLALIYFRNNRGINSVNTYT